MFSRAALRGRRIIGVLPTRMGNPFPHKERGGQLKPGPRKVALSSRSKTPATAEKHVGFHWCFRRGVGNFLRAECGGYFF